MNIFKSLTISCISISIYYSIKLIACKIYTLILRSKRLVHRMYRRSTISCIEVIGYNKVKLLLIESGIARIIECSFSDLEEV